MLVPAQVRERNTGFGAIGPEGIIAWIELLRKSMEKEEMELEVALVG